jgi:hypothetical protein
VQIQKNAEENAVEIVIETEKEADREIDIEIGIDLVANADLHQDHLAKVRQKTKI